MKTWVPGEEVLAADMNGFLQTQVIATFTNAAQRSAQWPTPPNGALSQRLDLPGWIETYSGTAWRPIPGATASRFTGMTEFQRTTTGLVDVLTVAHGAPFTYPVQMTAVACVEFGFGSALSNATPDLFLLSTGAVAIAAPGVMQAPIGAWTSYTLNHTWQVTANGNPDFKTRITINAVGGTGTWVRSHITSWARAI